MLSNKNQRRFFEEVIKLDPNNWRFWGFKGLFHHIYYEYDSCKECMAKAYELAPPNDFRKLSGPEDLKYHGEIYKIYEIKPMISLENLEKIKQKEEEIGKSLPESLKEWYSLTLSNNLLRIYLFNIKKLSLNKSGHLILTREEDHEWIVKLDDLKDPLVIEKNDDDSGILATFSRCILKWVEYTDFSRVKRAN